MGAIGAPCRRNNVHATYDAAKQLRALTWTVDDEVRRGLSPLIFRPCKRDAASIYGKRVCPVFGIWRDGLTECLHAKRSG